MHACVRVHACWPLLAPDAHTLAPQRTAYSLHGVHARQVSCGVLPRTCIIALTSSPNRHPAACAWLASISHRVARGFLDGAHDCAMPSALPLPLRGWWWRMRQASQAAGERSHFRCGFRQDLSKTKKNCNRRGAHQRTAVENFNLPWRRSDQWWSAKLRGTLSGMRVPVATAERWCGGP